MSSVCGLPWCGRRIWTAVRPLNPYGLADYVVLITGIVLVVLVMLDWAFPSGTRARELGIDSAERTIPQALRGAILLLLLFYVGLTGWDPGAYGFLCGRALFFLAAYMFLSVFFYAPEQGSRFFAFAKSLTWIVAAIASYRLTLGGHLSAGRIRGLAAAVLTIASAYTIPFCLDPARRIGQNADASLLLWCIPLLLISRPRLWVLGLTGVASIAVLVTVKRGAMLALFAGGLAYSILSRRVFSRRLGMRDFIIIALAVTVMAAGLFWQWENLQYRIEKDFKTAGIGSGRAWFYRIILSEWYQSSLPGLIFGRGFYTVPGTLAKYGDSIYAHSDWLEILYDMGLVGVVLFGYLHFQLIRQVYAASKRRLSVAPALTMGYCIFALRSIYSQCVIEDAGAIYFALLLGYATAVGAARHDQSGISRGRLFSAREQRWSRRYRPVKQRAPRSLQGLRPPGRLV